MVVVRDSGPGLDSKSLERLFEPFYTTKPQGMGMGLAICRSIIEAHAGRLWATTNEIAAPRFTSHCQSVRNWNDIRSRSTFKVHPSNRRFL